MTKLMELQDVKDGQGLTTCGNCGSPRHIYQWVEQKCGTCGDDEIDYIELENDPSYQDLKNMKFIGQ